MTTVRSRPTVAGAVALAAASALLATAGCGSGGTAATDPAAGGAATATAAPTASASTASTPTASTPGPATASGGPRPTCGGKTVDRGAPVITDGGVTIHASPQRVWSVLTNIPAWPTWKRDVPSAMRLDSGPLRVGSRFRWENGGLHITSTVRAVDSEQCVLWDGPADGIQGIHLWTLTPVAGGTLVHTEESWSGDRVGSDPAAAKSMLAAGLAAGTADLRAAAERTPAPPESAR